MSDSKLSTMGNTKINQKNIKQNQCSRKAYNRDELNLGSTFQVKVKTCILLFEKVKEKGRLKLPP